VIQEKRSGYCRICRDADSHGPHGFRAEQQALAEGSVLDLFRLTGGTKAFGQFEKGLLFLPASFDSVLDSRGIACIVCSLGCFALSRWTKVGLHNPLKRERTLEELANCLVLVCQHSAYPRITRLWLWGRFVSCHIDCHIDRFYFTSAGSTVQHQVFSPGINCVG
jgi:hypothetical protein